MSRDRALAREWGKRGRRRHDRGGRHKGRDWGKTSRRLPSARALLAVLVAIVVLALVFVSVQVFARSVPTPRYQAVGTTALAIPGAAPTMPLPSAGEATVGVLGVGTLGSSGGDGPVPIASLTKVMTAYLILADHPLTAGEQGPSITVTAADAAQEATDAAGSQSVVAVAAGEQLTELQALEALLVASANNIATLLAAWDSGSVPAFVARMNAEAAKLGMTATHYTDPTGVAPATVSSAADQVKLASLAMTNPVFSMIVALPQVSLPVAGNVFNYDALVGHDGIIGIKTGSTTEAGGCFVFAASRSVDGVPVTIIGAVLGQQGPSILQAALNASLALVKAASGAVRVVSVALPDAGLVGRLEVPWAKPVPLDAPGDWKALGWPGLSIGVRAEVGPVPTSLPAGALLGRVDLSIGQQSKTLPVVARTGLPRAPLSWRLERL